MNNEVWLSVIIPVYNGEKYIRRVAESLIPQLTDKMELIFVNDGSTDKSGSICDSYVQNMPVVKVLHKSNGGVSSAKNAGIALAQGKYMLFVDADDYLDLGTLSFIEKVIESKHPDCIDFGWKYISSSGEITHNMHNITKNTLLNEEVIKNIILPPLLNLCHDPEHFIYDFSWGKVFSKKIISKNGIVFNEKRRVWEDRPFVIQYLKCCKSYYCIDKCFYNYSDTPDSLSRRYSMDFFDIILENYQLYTTLFEGQYNFNTQYVNGYWSKSIENMILLSLKEKGNSSEIQHNILEALRHEQVIRFFSNRVPKNTFERKVGKYIQRRRPEKALNCYIRKNKQNETRMYIQKKINQIKDLIKE